MTFSVREESGQCENSIVKKWDMKWNLKRETRCRAYSNSENTVDGQCWKHLSKSLQTPFRSKLFLSAVMFENDVKISEEIHLEINLSCSVLDNFSSKIRRHYTEQCQTKYSQRMIKNFLHFFYSSVIYNIHYNS